MPPRVVSWRVDEGAIEHDGKRCIVLEVLRDVALDNLERFLVAQPDAGNVGIRPFAKFHRRSALQALHPKICQELYRRAKRVGVLAVQAHRSRNAIAALMQKFNRRNCTLFSARHPAEPVMAADSVKGKLEARTDAARLERIEQGCVHQPAIRVDGLHANLVFQQRVDDVHEVAAHERLAARDAHGKDAAFGKLLHHVQKLLAGGDAVFRVGRRHETVPAGKVAGARDGPLQLPAVARRICVVALLWAQEVEVAGRVDDSRIQHILQKLRLAFAERIRIDFMRGVALHEQVVIVPVEKTGLVIFGVIHAARQLVPPTQPISFVEYVLHAPARALLGVALQEDVGKERPEGGGPVRDRDSL